MNSLLGHHFSHLMLIFFETKVTLGPLPNQVGAKIAPKINQLAALKLKKTMSDAPACVLGTDSLPKGRPKSPSLPLLMPFYAFWDPLDVIFKEWGNNHVENWQRTSRKQLGTLTQAPHNNIV